jgi:hypothetical protein
MVTGCVLFEVRTEFWNIIYTSFGFEVLEATVIKGGSTDNLFQTGIRQPVIS